MSDQRICCVSCGAVFYQPQPAPPPAPADVLAETPENVERVARAIFAADRLHNDGGTTTWDGLAPDYHRLLRGDAAAVLAALRTARDLPPNSDSKGKG